MNFGRPFLYLWASPNTAVGSLFLLPTILTGGRAKIVDGILELQGGFTTTFLKRWTPIFMGGGAAAMTLGHIVLGQDQECLDDSRAHERIHVNQCEQWGPLFLPAYLLSSLVLWIQGRDAYYENPFEREAYSKS